MTTIRCYIQNIQPSGLVVSEQKICSIRSGHQNKAAHLNDVNNFQNNHHRITLVKLYANMHSSFVDVVKMKVYSQCSTHKGHMATTKAPSRYVVQRCADRHMILTSLVLAQCSGVPLYMLSLASFWSGCFFMISRIHLKTMAR